MEVRLGPSQIRQKSGILKKERVNIDVWLQYGFCGV
jgi:hypothetical protein